jgi:hypothetical protein
MELHLDTKKCSLMKERSGSLPINQHQSTSDPSCLAQENQCALQAQNNLAVLYEECQQPLEWDRLGWVWLRVK